MKGVVDRFSEEFVETRMKALDKFLKRVADHPVLSFNPHLNAFLSAKVRRRITIRPECRRLVMALLQTILKEQETREGYERWKRGSVRK